MQEKAKVAPQVKHVDRFRRFAGIVPPDEILKTRVNLIGCGGIGSWTAMGLACLGVKLTVWDPDKTEEHNFGGQPLPKIGEAKASQVADFIGPMSEGFKILIERFEAKHAVKHPARVWVSGVDSIESRVEIWEAGKAAYKRGELEWYVDGRMGGTNSHVLTVQMSDKQARKTYEKSLKPMNGFTEDSCAMRSSVFAGMGCAAEIVSEVSRILRGKATSRQRNTEWLEYQTIEGWTA